MTALFAPTARLPETWATNVRFEIDDGGIIESVTANASATGAQLLSGPVIPGMANLHSHAFQRAMAGLTEYRSDNEDDFWSWREAMYRFLAFLSPEDVEAIATQLYIELLKGGYTRVCEFHYLHNDLAGARYREPAAMAVAHLRAASAASIGITLAPTLYTSGGCGGKPLRDTQKRFAISPGELVEMVLALEEKTAKETNASIAVGLHSLRAVQTSEIGKVLTALPGRVNHIHVSEQRREVEECLAWCGRTPVAQLNHEFGLNEQWNLVHATHITPEEVEMIVRARATVTLCPSTEGNLGDGFFPTDAYFGRSRVFGIGTDSQVCTDPREELRLFEYGRRLVAEKRARSADRKLPNAGAWLWLHAAEGGAKPSAVPLGKLQKGFRADFVVIDTETPSMIERTGDTLFDALIFSAHGANAVRDVWVAGRRVIADFHHPLEKEAGAQFRRTMERWRSAA